MIVQNKWFERVYKGGVAVKGFDGAVELVAGLWLLVAPGSLHALLEWIFGKAVVHPGHVGQFVAEHVAHIDAELGRGSLLVVVLFLISHGVVKLALVYALLRELLWAYPYALAVLGAFLVYQLYLFATHPTLGMALFCLLDAIIIWLVWDEWQRLKHR